MFSFQDGLATNLTFRLTPNAVLIEEDSEFEPSSTSMERSLPDRNVTKDTITDAYVAFILYCNPQFPLDVDTSQLRSRFNSAPKSDNKEFESWTLFGLIKDFNAKKIETWGQLALDLGVEPPDPAKNQSVQKVQQYTVRLKRWMRALHIDAFFEYLTGSEHVYFTDIPPVDTPYPPEGRDGVPTEEDLAIRALEPSFRPKRGRRRNSEIEQEEIAETLRQSQVFDQPSSAYPHSAIPGSAHPMHDQWAAASAISTQNFAPWHVQSAVTPSGSLPWDKAGIGQSLDPEEPQSAILPSGRKRRKHGPAVSSAWSASTPSGSKPRGRPPAARTAQEGPFSAFPVLSEPEQTTAGLGSGSRSLESGLELADGTLGNMPPPSAISNPPVSGRPARLSLTVPQHAGGPIRLATPPRVIVRGEGASERESISHTPEPSYTRSIPPEAEVFTFEMLKRTLASDLLRADVVGRPHRMTGDEAKRLADSILDRMNVARLEVHDLRACVGRLTIASWLGLGDQLRIPSGPAAGSTKKIRVTRFRLDAEGYEEVVPADEPSGGELKQVFDIRWQAAQGACQGKFEMSGLTLAPAEKDDDPHNIHDVILHRIMADARNKGIMDELGDLETRGERNAELYKPGVRESAGTVNEDDETIDWKAKYRLLEFGTAMAHGEFDRYKEYMLQKVLDAFL